MFEAAKPVLVLGGRERHALAIVRSLGKKGIPVYVADDHSYCTGALSKYSKGQFVYPSPEKYPEKFVAYLLQLLQKKKFEMVFAVTDLIPILLAKNKALLSPYSKILVPDWNTFQQANNKKNTFDLARDNAIPMPDTYYVAKLSEIKTIAPRLQYPVVLKPASKTNIDSTGGYSLKAVYAQNTNDLVEKFTDSFQEGLEFLVQEYIPGEGGYGVGLLCQRGTSRASFAFKRLHEYPTSGGASTLRMGIRHPEMVQTAERLMQAMQWDGVAMVEFKIDSRDNKPKLIEVNGRFWGSLALAIYSGVDFPFLLYKQSRNEELPRIQSEIHRKARWLIPGDIMYFFECIRLRKNIFSTFKEFFQFRNISDDVISLSDPLPILGEIKVSFCYFVEVLAGKRSLHGEWRKKR